MPLAFKDVALRALDMGAYNIGCQCQVQMRIWRVAKTSARWMQKGRRGRLHYILFTDECNLILRASKTDGVVNAASILKYRCSLVASTSMHDCCDYADTITGNNKFRRMLPSKGYSESYGVEDNPLYYWDSIISIIGGVRVSKACCNYHCCLAWQ